MSTATAEAKKWTCEGCGVSAGSIDGEPGADAELLGRARPRAPTAWSAGAIAPPRRRSTRSPATARSPSGQKLRRAALIEFEVSRTPDQTDGIIARACRTSVSAVTRARRRLELPDPPPTTEESRAKRRAISRR